MDEYMNMSAMDKLRTHYHNLNNLNAQKSESFPRYNHCQAGVLRIQYTFCVSICFYLVEVK